jgi:GNAT superfamily N-acetyltransferase
MVENEIRRNLYLKNRTPRQMLDDQSAYIWVVGKDFCPDLTKDPKNYTIKLIRGVLETADSTKNKDYFRVAWMMSDPENKRHLRLPITPIGSVAKEVIDKSERELGEYYHNKNLVDRTGRIFDGDPQDVTPIVAVDASDMCIAALDIRWRGGAFEYEDKVASIESFVVDSSFHGKHIGTQLLTGTLDIAYYRYKGYGGESASAVRLWVSQDKKTGEYSDNINFYRDFGFETVGRERGGNWIEFAEKNGIPNPDHRDGQQYILTKEKWERIKKEDALRTHPKFTLSPGIIDEASLRIPHEI